MLFRSLYRHDTMDELLHIAITLENVNKVTKVNEPSSSNQPWKRDQGRGTQGNAQANRGQNLDKARTSNTQAPTAPSTKVVPSSTSNPKGSTSNPTSKARDITCFKCQGKGHYMRDCPNNRVMILNDRGEYES